MLSRASAVLLVDAAEREFGLLRGPSTGPSSLAVNLFHVLALARAVFIGAGKRERAYFRPGRKAAAHLRADHVVAAASGNNVADALAPLKAEGRNGKHYVEKFHSQKSQVRKKARSLAGWPK